MKKTLLLFLISFSGFSQIERVEPPFWWSDMTLSNVQIMFYGKNIAQNEVTVSNGIVINGIQKTENPNYIFVTIDTKNSPVQDLVFTFKNGKKVFTQKYTLKTRKENSRFRKGFDSSDVIYLIMPDRFANGNPNNDSHPNLFEKADRNNKDGRHGGDIDGIIKNLDYIKELGATAIWPTPLCEDNDEKGSYHTYGQSDVYKIDPRFGTNDEYVKLSAALHLRGMKNIMDYVTNHWGYKHWMINDLPTYDWIHQFPGYKQTNYRMNSQFDSNASKSDSNLFEEGWFVKSMPDLNQNNPLVQNYLIQNAIWWIEYADLDGFRVDTYPFGNKNAVAQWTNAITTEYPNFNIVGEVWYHNPAQNAYWQKDSKIGAIESFNSNLPSVMDFTLQEIINGGVFNENENTWNKGMVKVYDNFTSDFMFPNCNNLLVFAENHDTDRFNEICKNDFNKYKMGMALIATVRGIPQLYYGSEVGISGSKSAGDGDIRRDFPGGWIGDNNNAFTKLGRTEEQQKFYEFTAKLFNWRKSKSVIHYGLTTHYAPENNVYVYFRYMNPTDKTSSKESECVMIIINNNREKQTIKTNRFLENIKSRKLGFDVISENTINLENEIVIEGKSLYILELK